MKAIHCSTMPSSSFQDRLRKFESTGEIVGSTPPVKKVGPKTATYVKKFTPPKEEVQKTPPKWKPTSQGKSNASPFRSVVVLPAEERDETEQPQLVASDDRHGDLDLRQANDAKIESPGIQKKIGTPQSAYEAHLLQNTKQPSVFGKRSAYFPPGSSPSKPVVLKEVPVGLANKSPQRAQKEVVTVPVPAPVPVASTDYLSKNRAATSVVSKPSRGDDSADSTHLDSTGVVVKSTSSLYKVSPRRSVYSPRNAYSPRHGYSPSQRQPDVVPSQKLVVTTGIASPVTAKKYGTRPSPLKEYRGKMQKLEFSYSPSHRNEGFGKDEATTVIRTANHQATKMESETTGDLEHQKLGPKLGAKSSVFSRLVNRETQSKINGASATSTVVDKVPNDWSKSGPVAPNSSGIGEFPDNSADGPKHAVSTFPPEIQPAISSLSNDKTTASSKYAEESGKAIKAPSVDGSTKSKRSRSRLLEVRTRSPALYKAFTTELKRSLQAASTVMGEEQSNCSGSSASAKSSLSNQELGEIAQRAVRMSKGKFKQSPSNKYQKPSPLSQMKAFNNSQYTFVKDTEKTSNSKAPIADTSHVSTKSPAVGKDKASAQKAAVRQDTEAERPSTVQTSLSGRLSRADKYASLLKQKSRKIAARDGKSSPKVKDQPSRESNRTAATVVAPSATTTKPRMSTQRVVANQPKPLEDLSSKTRDSKNETQTRRKDRKAAARAQSSKRESSPAHPVDGGETGDSTETSKKESHKFSSNVKSKEGVHPYPTGQSTLAEVEPTTTVSSEERQKVHRNDESRRMDSPNDNHSGGPNLDRQHWAPGLASLQKNDGERPEGEEVSSARPFQPFTLRPWPPVKENDTEEKKDWKTFRPVESPRHHPVLQVLYAPSAQNGVDSRRSQADSSATPVASSLGVFPPVLLVQNEQSEDKSDKRGAETVFDENWPTQAVVETSRPKSESGTSGQGFGQVEGDMDEQGRIHEQAPPNVVIDDNHSIGSLTQDAEDDTEPMPSLRTYSPGRNVDLGDRKPMSPTKFFNARSMFENAGKKSPMRDPVPQQKDTPSTQKDETGAEEMWTATPWTKTSIEEKVMSTMERMYNTETANQVQSEAMNPFSLSTEFASGSFTSTFDETAMDTDPLESGQSESLLSLFPEDPLEGADSFKKDTVSSAPQEALEQGIGQSGTSDVENSMLHGEILTQSGSGLQYSSGSNNLRMSSNEESARVPTVTSTFVSSSSSLMSKSTISREESLRTRTKSTTSSADVGRLETIASEAKDEENPIIQEEGDRKKRESKYGDNEPVSIHAGAISTSVIPEESQKEASPPSNGKSDTLRWWQKKYAPKVGGQTNSVVKNAFSQQRSLGRLECDRDDEDIFSGLEEDAKAQDSSLDKVLDDTVSDYTPRAVESKSVHSPGSRASDSFMPEADGPSTFSAISLEDFESLEPPPPPPLASMHTAAGQPSSTNEEDESLDDISKVDDSTTTLAVVKTPEARRSRRSSYGKKVGTIVEVSESEMSDEPNQTEMRKEKKNSHSGRVIDGYGLNKVTSDITFSVMEGQGTMGRGSRSSNARRNDDFVKIEETSEQASPVSIVSAATPETSEDIDEAQSHSGSLQKGGVTLSESEEHEDGEIDGESLDLSYMESKEKGQSTMEFTAAAVMNFGYAIIDSVSTACKLTGKFDCQRACHGASQYSQLLFKQTTSQNFRSALTK